MATLARNSRLYVNASDGQLYAVNPDGSPKWSFALRPKDAANTFNGLSLHRAGALVRDDGNLYATSGRMLSQFAPDGSKLWSITTNDEVLPIGSNRDRKRVDTPAASAMAMGQDGSVYVGGDKLYAVQGNGSLKWSLALDPLTSQAEQILVAPDGTIYVSVVDIICFNSLEMCRKYGIGLLPVTYLAAVNPDGTLRWKRPMALSAMTTDAQSRLYGMVVDKDSENNTVFQSKTLVAISGDGQTLWQRQLPEASPVVRGLAVSDNGDIYVPWENFGSNAAGPSGQGVGVLRSDGSLKWFAWLGAMPSAIALGDDQTIYAVAGNQRLYALQTDRSLAWNFEASGVLNTLSLAADGSVVLAGNLLYVINSTATGGLESAVWAMPGARMNNRNLAKPDGLARRALRFSGKVSNLNLGTFALENATVTIKDAQNRLLCEAVTDLDGQYLCGTQTTDLGTGGLRYAVNSQYGSFEFAGSLVAGAAAQTTVVENNLRLPITTLRLTGKVLDSSNNPVMDALVGVRRLPSDEVESRTSNAAGQFESVYVLPQNTDAISLEVTVAKGSVSQPQTLTINLPVGAYTERNLNFVLDPNAIGSLRWQYDTKSEIVSAGALSGETAYFATVGGKLLALQAGNLLWSANLGVAGRLMPTILPDGRILVAAGRTVLVYNTAGVEQWRLETDSEVVVAPVASRDGIFVATRTRVLALGLSGQSLWSLPLPEPNKRGLAIANDGTLYLASADRFFAFNPDGSLYWVIPLSLNTTPLVADDGMIYVASGNLVVALLSNSQELWRAAVSDVPVGTLILSNDGILAGSMPGQNRPMVHLSKQGRVLRSLPSGDAMALAADGVVYSSDASQMRAFTMTAQPRWQANTGGSHLGAPLITNDGTVIVGSRNGQIYGFRASSTSLANTTWARAERDHANSRSATPNLTTNRRQVRVSGVVRHQFLPNLVLPNIELTLETATGSPLCNTFSDDTGAYQCSFYLRQAEAMPVLLKSQTTSTSAELPMGAFGSQSSVVINHFLPKTTVEFFGVVRNRVGKPMPEALVRLKAGLEGETYTNADGVYVLRVPVNNAGAFSVNFEASKGVSKFLRTVGVVAPTNLLTRQEVNFDVGSNQLGQVAWQMGGSVPGVSIGAGNLIFTAQGAFDGDGVPKLETRTSTRTAIGAAGRYFTTTDNALAAHLPDGNQLWSVALASGLSAPTLAHDGSVYTSSQKTLFAVQPTGVLSWQLELPRRIVSSAVVGTDGTIYLGTAHQKPTDLVPVPTGGQFYAVNPDGTIKWQTAINTAFQAATLGADGTIYVPTGEVEVVALKANDGSVLWRTRVGDTIISEITLNQNEDLLVPVVRGASAYLQAVGSDGRVKWEYSAGKAHISSATIGQDGSMVVIVSARCRPQFVQIEDFPAQQYDVPCGATTVRSLKPDRSVAWEFSPATPASDVGGQIDAPVAITDDGLVLATINEDNERGQTVTKLVALNSSIAGLATTPWAVVGRESTYTSRARGDSISRRMLVFSGFLKNRFGAGEPLANQIISVSSNNTFLCRTQTDRDGRYRCGTQNQDLRQAPATVAMQGVYGSSTSNINIPAGILGLTYEIKTDILFDATTLRLQGEVRNAAGELAIGATVRLLGPDITEQPLVTDANGMFDVYLLAPAGKTSLTLELRYQDQAAIAINRQTYNLNANALNQRTVNLAASTNTAGTVRLSAELGLTQSPLVRGADGYFYGIDVQNRLISLNREGQVRWSKDLGAAPTAPSISPDGTIVVGSSLGIYGINRDGSQRWFRAQAIASGLALGQSGEMYALRQDRLELLALDGSGKIVWRYSLPSPATGQPVVSAAGEIYLGLSTELLSLNANGSLRWTTAIPGVRWLAISDTTLYTDSSDGRLRALEFDKTERWQVQIGTANAPMVLAADETVYVGVADPSSTLQKIWAIKQGQKIFETSTTGSAIPVAVAANGQVVLTSSDRTVSGVDAVGNKVWTSNLATPLGLGGLIAEAELALVGADQKLYFVNLPVSGYANSAWARLGHDNQSSHRAGTSTVAATSRIVRLRGRITNQHWSSQTLAGVNVVVRDSGRFVCQSQSDADGFYACGGPASPNASLGVVAQNDDAEQTQTIQATGSTDAEYSLDLELPITTLEVNIAVKDSNAQPVPNANLTIQGNRNAQLLSDVLGEVKWLTTVAANTSALQLGFEARFGAYLARSNQTIALTKGQKTSLNLELRLIQIDPGTLRWQFATGGSLEQQPALGSDGTLYVGSSDRKLYAINPNGTERWTYTTGGEVIASPVVRDDGSIIVSASDNTITALEPSGTKRWVYTGSQPFELAPAVAADGGVYAIDTTGNLQALAATGQLLWSVPLGVAKAVPAIAPDGSLVVGSTGSRVLVLNPDGSPRFEAQLSANLLSIALDNEARIFALLENGKLVRLSKSAQVIAEQVYSNSTQTSGSVSLSSTAKVTFGGMSAFGDQRVYELLGSSLTARRSDSLPVDWTYNAPAQIGGFAVSDNLAYLAAKNGRVYAVNIESTKLGDGAWVKPGRDAKNSSRATPVSQVRRLVKFSGVVYNQFHRPSVLPNTEVTVLQGQEQWCRTMSDAQGRYTCTASISSVSSQNLSLQTQGMYGSSSVSQHVAAGSENIALAADLAVPVTTLQLQGRALDGAGQGIAQASIEITSGATTQNYSSAANGAFEAFLIFPSSQTSAELGLKLSHQGEAATLRQTLALTANQMVSNQVVLQLRTLGTQRWSVALGASSKALLATSNRIFVVRGDRLIGYDVDGLQKLVWSAPNATLSAPVLAGNSLLIGVSSGGVAYLQSLSATDLTPNGTFVPNPVTSQVGQPVVSSDGMRAFLTSDNRLIALNPDNTLRFARAIQPANLDSLSLASDGTWLVHGTQLQALNPDGTERWSVLPQGTPNDLILGNGVVYVTRTTPTGAVLQAYDLNGSGVFTSNLSANPTHEPILQGSNLLGV